VGKKQGEGKYVGEAGKDRMRLYKIHEGRGREGI
jgi:hypothetical protein